MVLVELMARFLADSTLARLPGSPRPLHRLRLLLPAWSETSLLHAGPAILNASWLRLFDSLFLSYFNLLPKLSLLLPTREACVLVPRFPVA